MSENFADILLESVERKGSPLCLGMDPVWEHFPSRLKGLEAEEALTSFVMEILECLGDLLPVVKFQMACFERYGSAGLRVLEKSLKETKKRGIVSILDCKRGDIGSTSKQYALAYLGENAPFPSDAVTLSPYLGRDSIEPFLELFPLGKGAFVLVRTSNPSARELQDLCVQEEALYLKVAKLVEHWGAPYIGQRRYSSLGAVVGATYPEELTLLRQLLPHTLFLVPGYGAQGAMEAEVALAFDPSGKGAIVNSSRQLIYAFSGTTYRGMEEKFAEAVRLAYLEAREKINMAIRERMRK
jgi:orotidine-5'-phosphate decarboxylase